MEPRKERSDPNEQSTNTSIRAVDDISSFQYAKLESDTAIRLFRIVSASTDGGADLVKISMTNVSIEDAPQYFALSYCWGSDQGTKRMLCNGQNMEITAHLYLILLSLASGMLQPLRKAQYWWVDQICINQANHDEKAHQVGLMKQIYARSSGTLVWLSPYRDIVDPALRQFWEYVKERRGAAPGVLPFSELPNIDSRGVLQPESEGWKPLVTMLRQPWFERIWVVQEIVFSKSEVWFHYDGMLIHYDLLSWLFYRLGYHRVADRGRGLEFGSIAMAATLRFDGVLIRRSPGKNLRVPAEDCTLQLSSLLAVTSKAKATDPRDRIYALYSFLSWERDPFLRNIPNQGRTDYSCDTYTLFRDVTRFCISEMQNLWIISQSGYVTDEQEVCRLAHTKIPTWALRLDLEASGQHVQSFSAWGLHETDLTDMRVQYLTEEVFSACGNRPLEIMSVSDLNVLSVKGVRVEKITACTRSVNVQPGRHSVEEHSIIEIWQAITEWLSFDPAHATDEDVDRFARAFADVIQPLDSVGTTNQTGTFSKRVVELATHTGSVMLNIWKLLAECGRAHRHNLSKPDETIALFDKQAQRAEYAAGLTGQAREAEYWSGTRYFVTESGRLGFGFKNVRPGDDIFVIYGETYPHALRRCGEEYHHLGEAFVRDYCDGSIMHDVDAGRREAVWINMR